MRGILFRLTGLRQRYGGRLLSGLALAGALGWLRCGPIPPALFEGAEAPSTIVVDRHGDVLYEALSADGERLERIDPARLPPALVAATLAAEDRRGFFRIGVDPRPLSPPRPPALSARAARP